MPYPLHAKPSWVSPENLVIWSFGHFAVFYAWLLLVLSLIWWIENRSFDEKKNRAGGNEDCGFCLLCFIYYLLFIVCFLTLISRSLPQARWRAGQDSLCLSSHIQCPWDGQSRLLPSGLWSMSRCLVGCRGSLRQKQRCRWCCRR